MKKISKIAIIIDSDNDKINYQAVVESVKSEITKYFGTKNTNNFNNSQPIIMVNEEVNNDDINNLQSIIDLDYVTLFAMVIPEDFNKIKGRILDLSE